MRSSTSSSDQSSMATLAKLARPLPLKSLLSSIWLGVLVFLLSMTAWELYWRDYGAEPTYRNSYGLWAEQRRRIDNGEGNKTVLLGSSRTLFDLQLPIWREKSGEAPIQLALEGTTPLPFMEDLADDSDFTGTLMVGVAPGLFFSSYQYRGEALKYYREESPSQWLGQRISMLLEPYLAFYDPDFALFAIIQRQAWPQREGVKDFLDVRRLSTSEADRHTRMWSKLENDTEYADLAKLIWAQGFRPLDELSDEEKQKGLEASQEQIERTITAVKKLQDKGVEVIFVRFPAEGHYAISEPMYSPRSEYWDVIVEKTGALGIHWQDHKELQGYWLPEWSHLSGSEADRYTAALYDVIQRERAKRQNEQD